MRQLFLDVLNLSLTSSILIVFVIIMRLILKNSPKIFAYLLWVLVFIRLVCPFTVEIQQNPIAKDIIAQTDLKRTENTYTAKSTLPQTNTLEQAPAYRQNTESLNKNSITGILSAIWALGVLALLIKSIISFMRLKKRLRTAQKTPEGFYESENIYTAFVFGIKPKIYLPANLSETEREYILLHEKTHIRRKDYLIKTAAYFILLLHWFNPLVWAAFHFFELDMESSCDEAVIKKMGSSIKKPYSLSILCLAEKKSAFSSMPSFGEKPASARIKNILKYKKPGLPAIIFSLILIAVSGCVLITSAPESKPIKEQALSYGREDCENYAKSVGTKVVNYTADAELKADFENLYKGIQIWELNYSFTSDTASPLPSTDSWHQEDNTVYGETKYLIFDKNNNKFLCELWQAPLTGTLSNLENNARKALESAGYITGPTFDGSHVLAEFYLSTGEKCHALLSQPAESGGQGIWCVERWMDSMGNIYHEAPESDLTAEEYYQELQSQCDNGHLPGLLDYKDTAYTFISALGQSTENVSFTENVEYDDFQNAPESLFFGKITNFNTDSLLVNFYRADYLTDENDSDKLTELGIDPSALPNGFYINEWDKWGISYQASKNMTYSIIDTDSSGNITQINSDNLKTFENYLKDGFPIGTNYFWIKIKQGEIISLEQQYIP